MQVIEWWLNNYNLMLGTGLVLTYIGLLLFVLEFVAVSEGDLHK